MAQEINSVDWGSGSFNGNFCSRGPIAGGNNPAHRIDGLLGIAEKRVNLWFGDLRIIGITLALNRDPSAVSMSSYKVDASVAAVPTGQILAFWPIGSTMNFSNLVLRRRPEDSRDEILKPSSFLTLVAAIPPDAF
ncbi:MAG: hypothetical protein OXG30_01975 [bacterium]|nr:hypothetical protein [bacterium]